MSHRKMQAEILSSRRHPVVCQTDFRLCLPVEHGTTLCGLKHFHKSDHYLNFANLNSNILPFPESGAK